MQIRPENTSRKIDHLGRVTIPKSLRDRLCIETNDELELFTMEHEGRDYICLSKEVAEVPAFIEDGPLRFVVAAKVLDELGFNIPEVLAERAGIENGMDV